MFGYDEEKLIGSGSFGKVYRVKDKGKYYALKELNDKAMRDREAAFLKLSDHPLFPKFIDSYDEGKFFILEEYIWGNPFDECIERRGGFAQPECMRFAISIADGIAYLQQSDGNILFRDLKAENLILQPDGEIRLADLGSACFLEDASSSVAGTVGASAPEQFEKGMSQGMYSDVYAFGMLLYHMLTGKRAGVNGRSVSLAEWGSGFSASLDLIIRQCTSPDPSLRIPDMYSVLQRLVDIATCTPRQYKKLEKNAKKLLNDSEASAAVTYSRNIQS